ncbi:MAG: sigma 54-interacting transcriptional regulator [Desulfovibrio sp.]|jgi:PAS domain S-box-containing protein|nr:sigma 54-interacting transcriptional regulator [Desulfovibrio sp.]
MTPYASDQTLREMQTRLNQAERSLARLLNHLPGLAYRCRVLPGFNYVLEFVSKGCEAMLGMSPEEVLAQRTNIIEQMMSEEDRSHVRDTMENCMLTQLPYEVYYHVTSPVTGRTIWVWDQGEGVFDDAGECVAIEGIMMDVTEQRNREQALRKENRQLRSSIRHSHGLGDIVGRSDAMQRCYRQILLAARCDLNVVIHGETGVGKDLTARTIHELSGVAGRFVPINCAAIPAELLESEFFGHVKGAFSGAVGNRAGHLAAAKGGTLFLDEVGELPMRLQGKLLRAIETRTFSPVGSSEVRQADFRLICATNRNLAELVESKGMREDFYFRIHVLPLEIPPLRNRTEDIPLLADAHAKHRGIDGALPPDALSALGRHTWPGNVRELHNVLDRYWALGELGPQFAGTELRASRGGRRHERRESRPAPALPDTAVAMEGSPPLDDVLASAERKTILATLDRHQWRKGETAKALGVTMRTLQRKLLKHGIRERAAL